MIQRYIAPKIKEHLATHNILVLLGTRGVQKFELVASCIENQEDILTIDASKKKVRKEIEALKVESYLSYFGSKKYILIRDAQYLANLQEIIEEVLDKNAAINLVLLCSYEPILDPVLRDVLQMEGLEIQIFPLLFQEIANQQGIVEFDKRLEQRIIFGNYPSVVADPESAETFLNQLVKDAIFTQLNPNERINKGPKLMKMLQILAFEIGQAISYNDVGLRCGLDNETVERYIELLEKAFLLKKIPCYFNNNTYELKKTHTVYFLDNGIRNAIIKNFHGFDLRNDIDALWKNWLIAERIKWNDYNGLNANYYFWKTHTKQQMDFIEERAGKLMAYKSLWDKRKKPKFPASFKKYYPEAGLFALNRTTYWGFLSKK
jgi:predicted AAA+ superfamily ATPase